MKTFHFIYDHSYWHDMCEQNIAQHNIGFDITDPSDSDFIVGSFSWALSPQKDMFWDHVYDCIEALHKKICYAFV